MEQAIIKIFGKKYTVNFPTVDEFIQIESAKMTLSFGQYSQMVATRSRTTNMALDLIDAFSTFLVLFPEMQKDGSLPDDINKLSQNQTIQLIVAYRSQYWPWFNKILRSMEEQISEAQKALIDAQAELQDEEEATGGNK